MNDVLRPFHEPARVWREALRMNEYLGQEVAQRMIGDMLDRVEELGGEWQDVRDKLRELLGRSGRLQPSVVG